MAKAAHSPLLNKDPRVLVRSQTPGWGSNPTHPIPPLPRCKEARIKRWAGKTEMGRKSRKKWNRRRVSGKKRNRIPWFVVWLVKARIKIEDKVLHRPEISGYLVEVFHSTLLHDCNCQLFSLLFGYYPVKWIDRSFYGKEICRKNNKLNI